MLFVKKRPRHSSNEDNMGGRNKISRTEASTSSDLPDLETYEVFLSFRGEETRKNFTDHLYKRLVDAGVCVFRDNEALHVGKEIGPELDKAIRASKISIPIISPGYASSKWCLRELVHILECKKTTGQVVLPIFYQVGPSSVRNQTGTFEEAFHLHEKEYGSKSNVVQEWRNALVEVASLKGWESSKIANGHEADLVEIVVTAVLDELRKATLIVTDCLVGIEEHEEKILTMLEGKASSDAQAILIHGMGGIGKTTLAKVIYNRLSSSFKHCCYLPNIREKLSEQKYRPEELQKQLISDIIGQQWPSEIRHVDEGINIIRDRLKQKRVLILFDDVDCTDQLNALARECSWFESGSILIITTRNKDVLKKWEGRLTYELNGLDSSLSLQLFCKHAFQKKDECCLREFYTIARGIVATTGGLPLAIEVIGSMLFGKSKGYWEDVLKKLQKNPHKNVQKTLKISYDALDYGHQQIFLDIACLSIQYRINLAFYMWDDCEFYPEEGIEELICRSLIKIGEGKQLTIHDQLRDLGREIVRQDAKNDLGNQSRLWNMAEALEVVKTEKGTAKIQALNLSHYSLCNGKKDYLTSEQFKNLTRLRFLQLDHGNLEGDFKNLLLDLRWLQWIGCLSIPTNFCPSRLVVLELSYGHITEHWEGWGQIQLVKKLRVLTLQDCSRLTSTPDFSAFEKLEILDLSWCQKLRRIHPSICNLNKTLLTLDVRGCKNLEELPTKMGKMEKLRQLFVDRTWIREIPISEGFMTKLEILSASFCGRLHHLPDSIGTLVNLVTLSLNDCTLLMKLPESIGKLKSLSQLNLKSSKVMELPDSIGELCGLRLLSISDCSFLSRLPESIHNLCSLQELNLSGCEKLKSILNLPCKLKSLNFSGEFMETLPNMNSLSNLKHLTYHDRFERTNIALNLGSLNNLESLSIAGIGFPRRSIENIKLILELPSRLRKLQIACCITLRQIPNLSNCKMLSSLKINHCINLSMLGDMGNSMTFCEVTHCYALERLSYNSGAKNLKSLLVRDSMHLMEIQGLDNMDCLEKLEVESCPLLERLDLSRLKMLKELRLCNCGKLSEFDGVDKLASLQRLIIEGCNAKIRSLHLSKCKNLKCLILKKFEILTEIRTFEYLKMLEIFSCNSLETLPDISLLTSLEAVHVDGCEKLTEIKWLQEQNTLKRIRISSCNSLETLPDISPLTSLEAVHVDGCEKLTEIKWLQEQNTLKRIRISSCNSLETLPDISPLTSLEEVHVDGCEKLTEIKVLQEQNTLKRIRISSCNSLETLPDISLLTSLEELHVDGCEKLTEIKVLQEHDTLKRIRISSCNSLETLPDISLLTSLEEVHVDGCEKLTEIKVLQEQNTLKRIRISICNSLETLPDISLLTSLEELHVDRCEKLTEMKGLQEQKTLKRMRISSCNSLETLLDISLLTSLEELHVDRCEKLIEMKGIQEQKTLKRMRISSCNSLETLPDISLLTSLEEVHVDGCEKLTEIKVLQEQNTLKRIRISSCNSLETLPDISLLTSLEGVDVDRCEKLTEMKGLQEQKTLKRMRISSCNSLETLLDISLLTSLEELHVDRCEKLIEMKGIQEQKTLKRMRISSCNSLETLPDISLLTSLEEVRIVSCEKLTEMKALQEQKTLKRMRISSCNSLETLPDISLLTSLEEVDVDRCEKLTEMKGLQEQKTLKRMRISSCNSLETLPDISLFTSLEEVPIVGCEKLTEIKGLREQKNFKFFHVHLCKSLENLPDFSLFTYVEEVHINECITLSEIKGIQGHKNLKILKISYCNSLDNLPDISMLTRLEEVQVKRCKKLTEIKALHGQRNLRILKFSCCKSIGTLPNFLYFTNLKHLIVNDCDKLTEIKGIPMSLRVLDVSRCKSLVTLPNFSKCRYLEELFAGGCSKLKTIMGLKGQEELKILDFSRCKSLKNFPDFSLFTGLEHLCLSGCEKLNEIKGLPISLKTLDISGCQSLVNLPDFSQSNFLEELHAEDCSKLEELRGLEYLDNFHVLAIHGCESLKRKPDLPNDCVHTDLEKTMGWDVVPRINAELNNDESLTSQVSIIGSSEL